MRKERKSITKRKKVNKKLFSIHKENSLPDNDNNINENFEDNKSIMSNENLNYEKDDDKKSSKWTDLNVTIISSQFIIL